jgi:hypothetical protein
MKEITKFTKNTILSLSENSSSIGFVGGLINVSPIKSNHSLTVYMNYQPKSSTMYYTIQLWSIDGLEKLLMGSKEE